MLKLRKYYKPFIFTMIFAFAFLFLQAMCELKLPDYMSDIVNIGIQANGIESVTPKAISENGLNLVTLYLNTDEQEFIKNNYTIIERGNTDYSGQYPLVNEQDIYVLKSDLPEEDLQKMDKLISISCRTLVSIIEEMSNNAEVQTANNNVDIDVNKIYEALPMLSNLPSQVIDKAKSQAEQTDESILNSIGVVFTKMIYEELGMDTSKIQMDYIISIGAKMLGICILVIVSAVVVGYLASRIGAGIGRNLRNDVFSKVESFSSTEFNKFSSASLITRTTNDITQVQLVTVMAMRMLAFAPIMGIGALVSMIGRTSSMMWIIGLGCSLIIGLIILLFVVVFPKIKIVQKLTDKLNLVSNENLSGIMVIRAFRTQKHEEKRFDEVNTEVTKTNTFINRSMGFMMPYMMLVMNLISVLVIWVGAKEIAASHIQVGDLMAVMQYGMHVIMSFLVVSMVFVMLPRASVSANRINEILETENSIKDPNKAKNFDENKKGFVEFKNVTFSYPDAHEKVLDNISFVAKPGETTAIIGSTGSGKSTLIQLIPRFFDVTSGEILVNGVNVKDVNQAELHEQIGYIPQKGNLLSGTIESNLKYGNKNATDEFMKKCAEVAQASEFIEEKDEKYQSLISQGAKNVSGGQKQRLSIARALVKDSPIYIFDDSFSALDFKTDSNLRKALKEHTGNSTIIIVAQRVSTIMNAEQILVLDKGKLVGKGTHKELLKNCETYYEIASSQLSKEELEDGE